MDDLWLQEEVREILKPSSHIHSRTIDFPKQGCLKIGNQMDEFAGTVGVEEVVPASSGSTIVQAQLRVYNE